MQLPRHLEQLIVNLTTQPHIHPLTRFFLHLFSSLQIIVSVLDKQSHLYFVLRWLDFSTFISNAIIEVLGLIMMSILIMCILWKLMTVNFGSKKIRIEQQYVSNFIVHLVLVFRSAFCVPLLKVSVQCLQNNEASYLYVLSLINIIVFFLLVFPCQLLLSSNTFLFINRTDNILRFISSHLLFNIFRIVIATIHPLGSNQLVTPIVLFIILYFMTTIKNPVVYYHHDAVCQHAISWTCCVCILYIAQKIEGYIQLSALYTIIGMVCFGFTMQAISSARINKILSQPQPNPNQIKILLYFMSNGKKFAQKLQHFILQHRRACTIESCKCEKVIRIIGSGTQKQWNEVVWFQFLGELVKRCYNLQQIKSFSESKMKELLNQYECVVSDLAQIYLFKLNRINDAFTIMNNFKYFIESRQLSYLTFTIKYSVIITLINQKTDIKFHNQGQNNREAHKYFDFQQFSQKYRKSLLRCSGNLANFWEQMNRRQPDEDKLCQILKIVQQSNVKIRKLYLKIVEHFKNSSKILDGITNAYFQSVLNISEKSKFHVILPKDLLDPPSYIDPNSSIIQESLKYFSFNSETPICLVSLNLQNLGLIVSSNHYFNERLSFSGGGKSYIEEFIIGELRESHQQKMKNFMLGDQYKYQHQHSLILNGGKLIYSNIFVQVVPSLLQGLRYAVFLKNYAPNKMIFCVKNSKQIKYTSEDFDRHHYAHHQIFLQFMINNPFQTNKNGEVLFENEEHKIYFKLISKINLNQSEFLFIQAINDIQNDHIFTKSNLSNAIKSQFKLQLTPKNLQISQKQETNIQQQSFNVSKALGMAQKEELICDSYRMMVNKNKLNLLRKMISLSIALVIGLVICSVVIVFLKQSNRQSYQKGFAINTNYHHLILNISKSVMWLHDTNYWMHRNHTINAQSSFARFKLMKDMNSVLDNVVKYFELDAVSEDWTTFACLKSQTDWKVSHSNNFLAFFDFYQNQMNKLNKANITTYQFGPSKRLTPLPLSNHQCYYWQLTTNALYIHLPNFRNLKESIMNTEIKGFTNKSAPIIITLSTIIFICLIFVTAKVMLKKKILVIKNESWSFLQQLSKETIDEKLAKCKSFITQYTIKAVDIQKNNSSLSPPQGQQGSQQENNALKIINKSISFNFDKMLDSMSERQLQINPKKNANQKSEISFTQKKISKKRKKTGIFIKATISSIICRYTLIALPFVLLSLCFIIAQAVEAKNITEAINIQQKFQKIKANINLLRTYAQLYGLQDFDMNKYLNVKAHLSNLVSQVYEIEREIINDHLKLQNLGGFKNILEKVGYGNLCEMVNSTSIFLQTQQAKCLEINNQILTKGFYSILVNYLQSFNNVLLSNTQPFNYTKQQQISYLSQTFFTQKGLLIPYFDQLIAHLLNLLSKDYSSRIDVITNLFVTIFLSIFGVAMLMAIFVERQNSLKLASQLKELKSIWQVISFETIVKREELKKEYLTKIELFNEIQ